MDKLKLTLAICIFLIGSVSAILHFTSENVKADTKVTFQEDDGNLCDPAGNSCIVVWQAPKKQ